MPSSSHSRLFANLLLILDLLWHLRCSYSSSNACSLATITDLFASFNRVRVQLLVLFSLVGTSYDVFSFVAVGYTSAFHHQHSVPLCAPFPDVSRKTSFDVCISMFYYLFRVHPYFSVYHNIL